MCCPEEQVRGVGLWWAALCMLDMPYGPVDWFLPTAPAHRMPADGRCLLYGLLRCCCCFVTTSTRVQSIAELLLPWDPGKPWIFVLRMERERKDAMITWKQISIFFPSQIISSRDVKGLFIGISFVSSQVIMHLVGELLRKEGSSVMAAGWACMG